MLCRLATGLVVVSPGFFGWLLICVMVVDFSPPITLFPAAVRTALLAGTAGRAATTRVLVTLVMHLLVLGTRLFTYLFFAICHSNSSAVTAYRIV